ncbi:MULTISPECIES: DedA family protein [Rhizobium]|uniref:Alkaline phosphatase n=1 Tax=Rhizobium miluonense TaxID=411945 RepID=A0A1C3U9H1_9HYPH|nr:DedA family protein [Rhizobium miluonense]SCB12136.1 alkaline phosphatase [Rhizobium miluonense]
MIDQSDLLSTLPVLAAWGLAGLLLCTAVEKLIPIIPSGGMLIVLGMFGASDASDLPWVVAITATGSTAGSLFWYMLGRWFGPERGDFLAMRVGKRLGIGSEWYWRLKDGYHYRGFTVTFVSQIIPFARAYIAFPAGVLAVPAKGFAIATFFGAALWNTPYLISGYMLRKHMFDQDIALPAAFAAIMLAYPLLFTVFRVCRPGRNAARSAVTIRCTTRSTPRR